MCLAYSEINTQELRNRGWQKIIAYKALKLKKDGKGLDSIIWDINPTVWLPGWRWSDRYSPFKRFVFGRGDTSLTRQEATKKMGRYGVVAEQHGKSRIRIVFGGKFFINIHK